MKPPFVRSPYNYDLDAASNASAYVETMPSLTVQSQSEDADLNVIMKRFGVTGKLPDNPRVPTYQDFADVTDFRSALHALQDAQLKFNEYPAEVRARFENDPQKLLEFVATPGNGEEGVRLGLWKHSSVASGAAPGAVPASPASPGASPAPAADKPS